MYVKMVYMCYHKIGDRSCSIFPGDAARAGEQRGSGQGFDPDVTREIGVHLHFVPVCGYFELNIVS
jgi:hypothetical protein